ncbi:ABC transporter ATP-binding protein [[Clostridium] hylemonae]|uniref:ABC transporter ATP-binding protein n=1 Tax=[Clostridium] hylemonae TaxID=89153 RepID=UPI001106A9E8|nr:ABC transporter ATP-binding protein [[Clostridium] hylemonae]
MERKISAENVRMRFKDKEVLKGISLSVSEGEIFGLLGPSGAGKTTLIKILTGQLGQTGGKAFIMGHDSRRADNTVCARIGMVMDNSGLYERLSCRDNLAVFTDIYGISKKGIGEALYKVGLADAAKTPVHKLSKGMRQRLVLARALMHRPEVLFLDEPTGGLDPATASCIHSLILEQRDRGTAVMMTTHNMEEAAKLCGRIALLNDGSIVEEGEPEEICRRYNHQNKIKISLNDGRTVLLGNEQSEAETIAEYFRSGMVAGIHSTEPDLQTVFMELTGRGL